jgi:general secretion pathway protein I
MPKQVDPPRDAGLTLVELAVAVLILAIGSIAAIRATDQARIGIGGAQDRTLAQLVARNRAEELRIDAFANLPSAVALAGQNFTVTTTTKSTAAGLREVTVVARSQNGAGALYVVYLPNRFGQ